MIKLIKITNGPLILAEFANGSYKYPVSVFEEDDVFKLGTFVEIADPSMPFIFPNFDFTCYPQEGLVEDYNNFVNDYLQKTK